VAPTSLSKTARSSVSVVGQSIELTRVDLGLKGERKRFETPKPIWGVVLTDDYLVAYTHGSVSDLKID
jgi:hypothetical protein